LASIRAISDWLPCFVEIGYSHGDVPSCDFLPFLRSGGVLCEKAMFQATHGVNTHKGAIFSLGLLCSSVGRLLANGLELQRETICLEVGAICADMVDRELSSNKLPNTAGERLFRTYGLTGARGEAMSGFSTVRSVALPVYDRLRALGVSEDRLLLQVLLHLLAVNRDTNIVSRGGLAGLDYVREYATNLLRDGGALVPDAFKKMEDFDNELIARHLSPGGSADLLAVTCFLVNFPSAESATALANSKKAMLWRRK